MSTHTATIRWSRTTDEFHYDTYNREHHWVFPSGQTVNASAAPDYLGSDACVDPEEAFAAALSSCHMLTFLAIAAKKRYTVDSYEDTALAILDKNVDGALAVTRVELRPSVTFSGTRLPSPEEIDAIHEKAHQRCFIANSVKAEVVVLG